MKRKLCGRFVKLFSWKPKRRCGRAFEIDSLEYLARVLLSLAKIPSPMKMARFFSPQREPVAGARPEIALRCAKDLLGGNMCACGVHICMHRRKVVRTRQLDRNDDAAHRAAGRKGHGPRLLNESCSSVLPSRVQDACGRHDSSGRNLRAAVSIGVHSAR